MARSVAAQLLVRWRINFPLRQEQAAEILNVSQSTLSRLESGERKPSRSLAVLIEQATGGSVPVESWERDEEAEA